MAHRELHRTAHIGWLRAAVLGANDGLISTSSLIVGVAAAQPEKGPILLAGLAGLVAGALSMAAGEYVSVSSQSDTEQADLARERRELDADPVAEHEELAGIYRARGLSPDLADQVARQLAAHDVLAAHARDELGMTESTQARPLQAAVASAAAFAVGALPPVLLVLLLPLSVLTSSVAGITFGLLLLLGSLAAKLGGAPLLRGAFRVGFWGAVAMGITALVGGLVGTEPASHPANSFAYGRPTVLSRESGERRDYQGRRPIVIKVDPQTVGSTSFSVAMEDLPPGDSIGIHKHLTEDEIVYVTRGHLQVTLGDSTHSAEAGALVFIPRGTWIGFQVVGADTATILFTFNTPGFEKCLRFLSAPIGSTFTRPSPEAVADARRDCHQVLRRDMIHDPK